MIQYAFLVAGVMRLGMSAILASTVGAVLGAIFNYLLSHHLVFAHKGAHRVAAPRFFSVALILLVINATVMQLFTAYWVIHYFAAQLIATSLVLLIGFGLNVRWTFGTTTTTAPDESSPGLRISRSNIIALVIIVILASAYYLMVTLLSVNMPFHDDYVQFLGTYIRIDSDASLAHLLKVVLEQPEWNGLIKSDHRLGFARLTMLISQKMFGNVDFRRLILIGNSFIAFWFFAIFVSSAVARKHWLLMVPAACLVFSLAHHDAALWASAALLYYPAIFFSLASIVAAHCGKRGLILSVIFGILAALAQANGLIIFPVIAMAYLVAGRKRAGALMGLSALVMFIYYFSGFTRPLAIPAYNSVGHAAWGIIVSWLQLQGNAFSGYALPFGILLAGLWLYFTVTGAWRRNPILFWFGVWLLGSMAAIAMGRASLGEDYVVSQNRYRFYGIGLLVVTYLLLVEVLVTMRATRTVFAFMLIVAVPSYARETYLGWRHQEGIRTEAVLAANSFAREAKLPQSPLWFPRAHEVQRILEYSKIHNLYQVPFYADYLAFAAPAPSPAQHQAKLTMKIDRLITGSHSLGISGTLEGMSFDMCRESKTLIFLEGRTGRRYMTAARSAIPRTKDFFGGWCAAYTAFVDAEQLTNDSYQIGVSIVREGTSIGEATHPLEIHTEATKN